MGTHEAEPTPSPGWGTELHRRVRVLVEAAAAAGYVAAWGDTEAGRAAWDGMGGAEKSEERARIELAVECAVRDHLPAVLAVDRCHHQALALREWIGGWPTEPDDGTFLGDVARDGLHRADRIEADPAT